MKVILLALTLFFIALTTINLNAQIKKKIAFIGRYNHPEKKSGSNEWYDNFAQITLSHFISELNRRKSDLDLSLEVFDIQHSAEKSDSVYHIIANDPEYLCVFDNSWGHDMQGAIDIIKSKNIPVISVNAYRGYNNYGNSAIFMLNYELNIKYLAHYAKGILGRNKVDLISEYDTDLHQLHLDAIRDAGLSTDTTITYKGQQNINSSDSIKLFSALKEFFKTNKRDSNRVIIYNAHFMWGNEIVNFLNENLKNSTFLSWSVPQAEYLKGLKNGNQFVLHQKSAYDIPEPIFTAYRDLLKSNSEYFIWDGAPGIMEDLKSTIDIIELYLSKTSIENINKNSLADFLSNLKNSITLYGQTVFKFNKNNQRMVEKTFTIFDEKGKKAAPVQLDENFKKQPVLTYGFNIEDIYDINFETTSFNSDFEYWVSGDSTLEYYADRAIRFKNIRQENESIKTLAVRYENGRFIKHYGVSGAFYNSFNGQKYPFDSQKLKIDIELNSSNEFRIVIAPETYAKKINELAINGWLSKDYYVTLENKLTRDKLNRDEEYFESDIIRIHYLVERNSWSSILLIVLPLFFIGMITVAILFLSSLSFSDLGEVIVGLFLSIIAFSLSLAELSPKFESLTKADLLFLDTFIIVFVTFIYLILLNSKWSGAYYKMKTFLRISFLIGYPISFFLIIFI